MPGTGASEPLLIAAAADLTNLEQPLIQGFQAASGYRVRFTFGASGMLAAQIRQGAPYDLFLSANEHFVTELAKSGAILPGSVRVYAYGKLGLWSKDGKIKRVEDLKSPGVLHLAMPNPAHAPYGVAARELLEKLNLWRTLQPKIVYGENVRQALQYAETGNAEAVITAWSLLLDRGGAPLPENLHAPIKQVAGIVTRSPNRTAAEQFLNFLGSANGRAILQRFGFRVPEPPSSPADARGRTRRSGR